MLSIDAWLDEKPYKELYDGVVHEKVSPQSAHGIVAFQIAKLLDSWSQRRGWVVPEWRVYLAEGTTLVPDVSFIFKDKLAPLSYQQRQKLPFAPDIVVEIRSPDGREDNIRRKTELYLAHGATLVVNVDPDARTVRLNDGDSETTLSSDDTIVHVAFPELQIRIEDVFAPLDEF